VEEKGRPFKKTPTRHHPKGLRILHEDHDILVVDKAEGLLTMGTDHEKQKTAYFLLDNYVKKGNTKSKKRIFIVHRLDRETSGILVFAKSEVAKRYLQDNWGDFSKKYFAVVQGTFPEKEGEYSSYLQENKVYRVYSGNDPDLGKFARTGYKVIRESAHGSLLEISLYTGRKHQIRVHLSENGHPVLGDKMYGTGGKGIKRLALHAGSLTIRHPFSHQEMCFETGIPPYFKTILG
jgi:tRNA pseudouridine32 synthase/23S rRNA pseudouridine746 synthase/23S rRNA pseudouridine1911/1915/1917 synthase